MNVHFKKVYNIDKVLYLYFNSCVESSYILMIFYSFLVAGICCVTAGVIPPNQFLGRVLETHDYSMIANLIFSFDIKIWVVPV